MIRAVLDANVFVSSLIRSDGPPGKILKRLVEDKAFELISSVAIMAELRRCLTYGKVRKYVRASSHELELWLTSLELISTQAEGGGPPEPRLQDVDDGIYLLAAFNGRATYIVSGDTHLLTLKEYQGTQIVSPAKFLRKI